MNLSAMTRFALLARSPDEALDLEAVAVGVARAVDPTADERAVAATLDAMAAEVEDQVHPSTPPDRLAASIARAFGGTLRLRGAPEVFVEPSASALPWVLERRSGLPILLGVVWILLGRRLGVPIAGVSYPGRFLVCLDAPGARIYLDPFSGGDVLEAADLVARLRDTNADTGRALSPCDTRAIGVRMLTNLHHLWLDRGDVEAALGALDRMLLLGGETPERLRDRGLLAAHLRRGPEAARDLRRYLALAPNARDRAVVEQVLATVVP